MNFIFQLFVYHQNFRGGFKNMQVCLVRTPNGETVKTFKSIKGNATKRAAAWVEKKPENVLIPHIVAYL